MHSQVLEEGRFGARGLEATFGVTIAHRQQAMAMQRLDARVGDLKRSEETLRKELAAARSAEQAARQSIAELAPLRTSLAKQNESIRRQNETVTKQNAAIRSQNESLRKLVEERDAVVRLLNERTELLNKLNAAGSSK